MEMKFDIKKMSKNKILLVINDIIILIFNIIILIILFVISNKEKKYRNTRTLFISQLIISFIIVVLDIILNFANIKYNYKGHNKYGMLIRFFMFYLIIPCVVLTYQRGNNLNHDDITNASNFTMYIGFINDSFVLTSMILSFILIEKKKEEKMLVGKNRTSFNMDSFENKQLLQESNENSQIFTELEKNKD